MAILVRVLAVVLTVLFCRTATGGTELALVSYGPEAGLFCNDGTSAGYYLRPAPKEEADDFEKSLWVVYLEGGVLYIGKAL
jgi:hypothetical protein